MTRQWKIILAIFVAVLILGLLTLPALLRSVLRLQRAGVTEEQARREIAQAQVATPTDIPEKAHLFWASIAVPGTLESDDVELPLSADPVQRSRQLLIALITRAPSDAQRTLPADAELLAYYQLPDGTAVADFSEALGTKTPSGILSEQMAVESILRTLGGNVATVHSLKILIHGQEADTLAGHLDLMDFFPIPPPLAAPVTPAAAPTPADSATPPASAPPDRPSSSSPPPTK